MVENASETVPDQGGEAAPPSRQRVVLSGWLGASAMLAYLCRNSISVAEKTIRTDLEISEQTMGFVLGAFFWSYALAQIPCGWLGQRFGNRLCLPVFNGLSSVTTLLISCATGPTWLLYGRVGSGVAQAGLFPCATLSIARWYPRGERALASAALGSAMSVGGAIGVGLTGELLDWSDGFLAKSLSALGSTGLALSHEIGDWLNWRRIFGLYALPGLVWSAGFAVWFRDSPRDHPRVNAAEREWIESQQVESSSEETQQSPVRWRNYLTNSAMWLICTQQFFRAAGYAFFASWFATYLQETRGVSTSKSGWLLTIPLLATVVASLMGGSLSDRIHRRTHNLRWARCGLASVTLMMCAGLVFAAYFINDATNASIIIGLGAFFAAFAGPCAYASTIDMGGRQVATVFGAMNMIGNFGAGLLPPLVPAFRTWVNQTPWLLDMAGGNSWNLVLPLFAVMYVCAALCWLILPIRENCLENP